MALDTCITDMVALVTARDHPRFGQMGQMMWHDWKEYGMIGVSFLDGKTEQFHDGMCEGDPPSQLSRFYRHYDDRGRTFDEEKGCGPMSLIKSFLDTGRSLAEFTIEYMGVFGPSMQRQEGDVGAKLPYSA